MFCSKQDPRTRAIYWPIDSHWTYSVRTWLAKEDIIAQCLRNCTDTCQPTQNEAADNTQWDPIINDELWPTGAGRRTFTTKERHQTHKRKILLKDIFILCFFYLGGEQGDKYGIPLLLTYVFKSLHRSNLSLKRARDWSKNISKGIHILQAINSISLIPTFILN